MNFSPRIKIIGLGGCGVNMVSQLAHSPGFEKVELWAANTDEQSLNISPVSHKILIGPETTFGLGTGMDLKLAEKAVKESLQQIEESLKGADLLFIACGLGGGTGTAAASLVAEVAQKMHILTIAVLTTPFSFEGAQRQKIARLGLKKLQNNVDSIINISNDKLLKVVGKNTLVNSAFQKANDVLKQAILSISELANSSGIIDVNFADICQVLKKSGEALFGQASARGENRIIKATEEAVHSPLVTFPLAKAKGILLNITGGEDLTLFEVRSTAELLKKLVSPKAKIIFGASENKAFEKGEIKVTVIATGF